MVNFSHEVLSFNSFLIFACFQGAKLSFSRTMLLPVAGNDYLWFHFPDLGFFCANFRRKTRFKCATIHATICSVQDWPNSLVAELKSSEADSTEIRDRRTWTFNGKFPDKWRSATKWGSNGCALPIKTMQETIFDGPRHLLCFVEADFIEYDFCASIFFLLCVSNCICNYIWSAL